MTELVAYTDGACSGNPGPGGWGVVLIAQADDVIVKGAKLENGLLSVELQKIIPEEKKPKTIEIR